MKLGDLKIISGTSNTDLAREIADYCKTGLAQTEISRFPDGELHVQINENIRGKDLFIIQSTCPPANEHIMELLILIDAARRASAQRITAVVPFYGYARQDRKDKPRVPITAKLVANLLTTAGANRILTMDLHAQQIQGFFDIPVDHLYASPLLFEYLKQYLGEKLSVFSPDVGGMKMAAAYAEMLKCPLGFVAKRRTDASTVQAMNFVGEVEGRDILLVDDMTETAGTLIAAARLLKERGAATVRAAVTHCVLRDSGYEKLKGSALDELVTTNTIPRIASDGYPIHVVSVAPVLAEAILRINTHESVTSLFDVQGF